MKHASTRAGPRWLVGRAALHPHRRRNSPISGNPLPWFAWSGFQTAGAWNLCGNQPHHPTPVLRYSEEPDRASKNPALRSTSEPASSAKRSSHASVKEASHARASEGTNARSFVRDGAIFNARQDSPHTPILTIPSLAPTPCRCRSERVLPRMFPLAELRRERQTPRFLGQASALKIAAVHRRRRERSGRGWF